MRVPGRNAYRNGTRFGISGDAARRRRKAFLGHAQKIGPDILIETGSRQLPAKPGMGSQAFGHLRLCHVLSLKRKVVPHALSYQGGNDRH